MVENFTLMAILITIAWLGLIGYYIYLSSNQQVLQDELNQLQERLDKRLGEE